MRMMRSLQLLEDYHEWRMNEALFEIIIEQLTEIKNHLRQNVKGTGKSVRDLQNCKQVESYLNRHQLRNEIIQKLTPDDWYSDTDGGYR